MPHISKNNAKSVVALKTQEVERLFTMSSELAEFTEDILAAHGAYRKEFITGLQTSLHQARSGKLIKANSLADLS